MQARTRRQKEVLDYITRFIEERGYEPSYTQIARHFRIASKSAIAKHISALETQGLISRQRENGSFGLQIKSKMSFASDVSPIDWVRPPHAEAVAEAQEFEPLLVPQFLLGKYSADKIVAYRVRDDAMLDEQICEGDIVLLERRRYARDGDIILAIIENKRTALKKYYRRGANVELRPANENYERTIVSADNVSIEGIFRGLIRPIN